jgi:NAD(P)H-hydrate epimerase
VALGPGLGADPRVAGLVRDCTLPLVVDADGLNALAGALPAACAGPRVFTPHPGETARLLGHPVGEPAGRCRGLAAATCAIVVLKGHRTVIATPSGPCRPQPDRHTRHGHGRQRRILYRPLALLRRPRRGGHAGGGISAWSGRELAAAALTERCVIATDLLADLPEAIRRCA